jgi:acetyl esterase/lipase
LLATEPYTLDVPETADAWRILYVTTRIDGAPALGSAVVMVPKGATGALHAITWAHGTTGAAPGCGPSVVAPFHNVPAVPELLAKGWAYVAADYVGLGTEGVHAYLVGDDAARSVLDSMRAAMQMAEVDILPQTVVWGHSQGGNSALWTGMVAKAYAPEIDVLGVAALAPASNLPKMVDAAQGSMFGKIVSSYLLQGYAASYADVRVTDYVSPLSALVLSDIAGRCSLDAKALVSFAELALLPGDLFGMNIDATPLGARLAENVPAGPYDMPVLLGQGVDDEIVYEPMQTGFAKGLCDEGTNLIYRRYEGRDHVSLVKADSPAAADMVDWTSRRFAGEVATSDCAGP